MNAANPPKLKRRWCQFSLRSLLLVMLACSMALGWRVHRARLNRQREVKIEMALAELGKIEGDFCGWAIVPNPIPLKNLTYMHSLIRSLLPYEATWLESLFYDPGGADARMHIFEEIPSLYVIIQDKKLSDDQLMYLNALPILDTLVIEESKITDAGLVHLAELTNLQDLWLESPNVTDAGLTHLEQLSKLEYLDLKKTRVTNAGVERLRQKLPNCQISWVPNSDKGEEETGTDE